MDWDSFVTLVSPLRLEILGIALGLTMLLGIMGAIKAKAFKWGLIASFLSPSLNFFWMIIGYAAVAFIASMIDDSFEPAVIGTYVIVVAAIVAKLKEQIAFLAPSLPLVNKKLPLES